MKSASEISHWLHAAVNDVMAPIELERFARVEGEWYIGFRARRRVPFGPDPA